MSFRVVIPARYDAARLPGKPLLDIGGKPMLQHVHARAVESDALEVIIATDHDRIVAACREFKADVRMTAADHVSGTDRIAEVCQMEGWSAADIIVNLQSDEPMMPPGLIQQVARLLEDFDETEMGTLACPVRTLDEFLDPHVVKVVLDANDDALYFSRAPIPWERGAASAAEQHNYRDGLRHLGLYAYRVATLLRLSSTPSCRLEEVEQLEQLRALYAGIRIRVGLTEEPPGPGVDTEDDLARVRACVNDNL